MIMVYTLLIHLHVTSISRIIDNWMQTVFEEKESGRQFTDFMTVSTMRNFTTRKAMKPETMCRLAYVTEYFMSY